MGKTRTGYYKQEESIGIITGAAIGSLAGYMVPANS